MKPLPSFDHRTSSRVSSVSSVSRTQRADAKGPSIQRSIWARFLSGLCFLPVLLLVPPGCTGTEAGNPYSPLSTSSCKGGDDYRGVDAGFSLGDWASDEGLKRSDPAPPPEIPVSDRLGQLSRIPIWLECIEWDTVSSNLSLQIANFRGGCGVDWVGGAQVRKDESSGEMVLVELTNHSCEVARCGNCIYDLRLDQAINLSSESDQLSVVLVRRDCAEQVETESSFVLSALEGDHGLSCRPADAWGAVMAADEDNGVEKELYAPCGEPTGDSLLDSARTESCAGELSCIDGRCVSSCEEDADCPLSPAEVCRDGFCGLVE